MRTVRTMQYPKLIAALAAGILCACGAGQDEGEREPPRVHAATAPQDAPVYHAATAANVDESGAARAARELPGSWQPENLVTRPRTVPWLDRSVTAPPGSKPPVWDWKADVRAVAIEGEEAPGTGGQRFARFGFDFPSVNEPGNVSFIGKYAPEASGFAPVETARPESPPGSGIFFWDRDEDRLSPVVVAGQVVDGVQVDATDNNQQLYPQMINDRDEVAFVAVLVPPGSVAPAQATAYQALIQAEPQDERCERFDLQVIARTGQPAPGGGTFLNFFDLEENERGDIAFAATFEVIGLPGVGEGVFLYKHHEREIVVVARTGDLIPELGARFCAPAKLEYASFDGPWLNGSRVVTFQANCILDSDSPTQHLPEFEGSIFKWTEERGSSLFLQLGSPGPRLDPCDSCDGQERPRIVFIGTGHPGLAEDRMVFDLGVQQEGSTSQPEVIATKPLEDGADDHRFDVCAHDFQSLGNGETLGVAIPSIGDHGVVSFPAQIFTWRNSVQTLDSALFTCLDEDLHLILRAGEKKPVGRGNTFGGMGEPSNSDRYVTFVEFASPPTGVFTLNSNPQLH